MQKQVLFNLPEKTLTLEDLIKTQATSKTNNKNFLAQSSFEWVRPDHQTSHYPQRQGLLKVFSKAAKKGRSQPPAEQIRPQRSLIDRLSGICSCVQREQLRGKQTNQIEGPLRADLSAFLKVKGEENKLAPPPHQLQDSMLRRTLSPINSLARLDQGDN